MSKCRRLISLVVALSFTGLIADAFADPQEESLESAIAPRKGYRRVFPGSVSPKPTDIQRRDARETMELEVKEEMAKETLLESEENQLKEKELEEEKLKEKEIKKSEELITQGDRLYKEGKYDEAAELYDQAYRLAKEKEEKVKVVGREPIQLFYQISIGDKLYIAVWRVPDLSLEFTVGPDGYISFPLIGDIYAYSKTLSELDAEITKKLKEYVVDPQVSVMIREFAGDNVTVIGEVESPGIYKFVRRANLIDIIAQARGFTDRAKIVSIAIVREPNPPQKEPDLIVVNAKEILKGKLGNIEIKPNDIVYVSRTFVSNLHEFYNNWITPLLGTVADTAIDYETFMALRRARLQ